MLVSRLSEVALLQQGTQQLGEKQRQLSEFLAAFPVPDLAETLKERAESGAVSTAALPNSKDTKHQQTSGGGAVTKKEREKQKEKEKAAALKRKEGKPASVKLSAEHAAACRAAMVSLFAATASVGSATDDDEQQQQRRDEFILQLCDAISSVVSRCEGLAARKAFLLPPSNNNTINETGNDDDASPPAAAAAAAAAITSDAPFRDFLLLRCAPLLSTCSAAALRWVRAASLVASASKDVAKQQLAVAPVLWRASDAAPLRSLSFAGQLTDLLAAFASSSGDAGGHAAETLYYACELHRTLSAYKPALKLLTASLPALIAAAASDALPRAAAAARELALETPQERAEREEEARLIAAALKGVGAGAAAAATAAVCQQPIIDPQRLGFVPIENSWDLAIAVNAAVQAWCKAFAAIFATLSSLDDVVAAFVPPASGKKKDSGAAAAAASVLHPASSASPPPLVAALCNAGNALLSADAAEDWALLAYELVGEVDEARDAIFGSAGGSTSAAAATFVTAVQNVAALSSRTQPETAELLLRLILRLTQGHDAAKDALCCVAVRDALLFVARTASTFDVAKLWVQAVHNLVRVRDVKEIVADVRGVALFGRASVFGIDDSNGGATVATPLLLGGRELFGTADVAAALALEIAPLLFSASSAGSAGSGAKETVSAALWLLKCLMKIVAPVPQPVVSELVSLLETQQLAVEDAHRSAKARAEKQADERMQKEAASMEMSVQEARLRSQVEAERRRIEAQQRQQSTSGGNKQKQQKAAADFSAVYRDPNALIAKPFIQREIVSMLITVTRLVADKFPDDCMLPAAPSKKSNSKDDDAAAAAAATSSKITELLSLLARLLDRLSLIFEEQGIAASSGRRGGGNSAAAAAAAAAAPGEQEFFAVPDMRNAWSAVAAKKIVPGVDGIPPPPKFDDATHSAHPLVPRAASFLVALQALARCDASAAARVGGTTVVRDEVLRTLVRVASTLMLPSSENTGVFVSICEYLASTADGVKLLATSEDFVSLLISKTIAGTLSAPTAVAGGAVAVNHLLAVLARIVSFPATQVPKRVLTQLDAARTVSTFIRIGALLAAIGPAAADSAAAWATSLGALLNFDQERRDAAENAASDEDEDDGDGDDNGPKSKPAKKATAVAGSKPGTFIAKIEQDAARLVDVTLRLGEEGCASSSAVTAKLIAALLNQLLEVSAAIRAMVASGEGRAPASSEQSGAAAAASSANSSGKKNALRPFRDRILSLFIGLSSSSTGDTKNAGDADKDGCGGGKEDECAPSVFLGGDDELLFVYLRLLGAIARKHTGADAFGGALAAPLFAALLRTGAKATDGATSTAWLSLVHQLLERGGAALRPQLLTTAACATVLRLGKQAHKESTDLVVEARRHLEQLRAERDARPPAARGGGGGGGDDGDGSESAEQKKRRREAEEEQAAALALLDDEKSGEGGESGNAGAARAGKKDDDSDDNDEDDDDDEDDDEHA